MDRIPFRITLRALKPEDAVQKVYADLGSRHKARQSDIIIQKVEEVAQETTET
jgi:ribosomal protein L20A (L18A)